MPDRGNLMKINMTSAQQRLAGFLLVSVLAHAVFFSGGDDRAINLSSRLTQAPGISATLLAEEKSSRQNNNTSRNTATGNAGSKTADKGKNASHENRTADSESSQAAAAVYAVIRGQMQNHFYYPTLARHQGWQGRVLLDFIINESGRLNDIRIRQSSGYDILDHAARQALSEVVIVNISRDMLIAAMKPGRMSLPVAYRLVN